MLSLHCSADGRVRFTITTLASVPDLATYVQFSNAAAVIVKQCVYGHSIRRGGVAAGLGKSLNSVSILHAELRIDRSRDLVWCIHLDVCQALYATQHNESGCRNDCGR